jgi:acetyl-CoA acetyltransferase
MLTRNRSTQGSTWPSSLSPILPIRLSDGTTVDRNGCLRPQTTLEGLAALKPAFRPDGSVTAGTASPLTDGAVAVLVTSANFATRHRLDVLAKVRSSSFRASIAAMMAGLATILIGVWLFYSGRSTDIKMPPIATIAQVLDTI